MASGRFAWQRGGAYGRPSLVEINGGEGNRATKGVFRLDGDPRLGLDELSNLITVYRSQSRNQPVGLIWTGHFEGARSDADKRPGMRLLRLGSLRKILLGLSSGGRRVGTFCSVQRRRRIDTQVCLCLKTVGATNWSRHGRALIRHKGKTPTMAEFKIKWRVARRVQSAVERGDLSTSREELSGIGYSTVCRPLS